MSDSTREPARRLRASIRFLLMAIGSLLCVPATLFAQGEPLPANLIPLPSAEGQRLLVESQARQDYFGLTVYYEPQKSQSFCGMASGVMVLNALGVPAPEVPQWAPYRAFTQDNLFNDEARRRGVARGGLTLVQLAELLQTHPVQARVYYASDLDLAGFRSLAARDLAAPGSYLIVNFLRSGLEQEPSGPIGRSLGGHFSPLGAYHAASDRFLLLDVARYKYPPVWVEAGQLFAAMNTTDVDSGRSRGFLVVSAAAGTKAAEPIRAPRLRLVYALLSIVGASLLIGAALGAAWMRRRMRSARRAP